MDDFARRACERARVRRRPLLLRVHLRRAFRSALWAVGRPQVRGAKGRGVLALRRSRRADRVATAETKASTQAPIAFWLLGVSQIIGVFALDGLKARNVLGVAPEAAIAQSAATPDIAENAEVAQNAESAQVAETAENAEVAQTAGSAQVAETAENAEVAQNGEIVETSAVVASVESAQNAETSQNAEIAAAKTDWARALRFPAIFCFVWGAVFFAFGREPKAPGSDDAAQEKTAAA